ncbi:MAG: hypothetical protein RJB57_132 [Actinomycetota bacterium]
MMRRLFWFVLGAVCGAAAHARVRALLGEAREAMTVRNVLAAVRALLGALWSTVRGIAFRYLSGVDPGSEVADSSVTVAPVRRHIATRPSSRHG